MTAMSDLNTMTVQAVEPTTVTMLRNQTLATGLRLNRLQSVVLAVAGGGPTFAADQEPLQDGVAYTDTSGAAYYRPQLAVAGRPPGRRPGPDVWFLKDDDGVITLTWTLETVPFGGQPAGALPLPITISAVTLEWDGGSRVFEAPGLDPVEGHAADQPAYLIHGGAQLTREEAATLEAAMNHHESACRLVVTYSYSYTINVVEATPDTPPPADPPSGGGFHLPPVGDVIIRDHRHLSELKVVPQFAAVTPSVASLAAASLATESTTGTEDLPVVNERVMIKRRISPALQEAILASSLEAIVAGQVTRPEARTQTVVRTVPFVFEPSDEQNGPIYRSLHGAANLSEDWAHGEAGWLCESVFPNTVNRLPDAMRIAWNPELGGPHMVPTLHRTQDGTPRVRLLLRLAPFHDPRQRVLARKIVGMPAATVVIGEVQGSTLKLAGSFPEELAVVGDVGAPAPLTGVDLVLDLSLAYYQLFCQQIASPIGVPGQVSVVLATPPATEGATPTPQTTQVEVGLRLDRVDDLPCTITLPDDPSPSTVTVTNASGAELTIGGAAVTLLQTDESSSVPVDTFPGRCTTTFPVTLAPGASVDLAVAADAPGGDESAVGFLWNAMLVELLDKKMAATPQVMLTHVHELAGSSEVSRDITVSSPVFSTATLPEKWASLASIEVEVTAPGGTPASVVLSPTSGTKTVAAGVSLLAVATGAPGGITTVDYRVRNNYLDHQGRWGETRQSSGSDLIAYPNPPEGD